MDLLPALRLHCPACGSALSLHERYAGGHCNDWQCRHRRDVARRRAELAAQLVQARDAAAAAAGVPDPAQVPVVMVRRHAGTDLVPVPELLREKLRAHMQSLQAEVEAAPDESAADDNDNDSAMPAELSAADPAALSGLLGQVCARCVGYCCRHGNSRNAFIDVAVMRRARLRQPDLPYQALVEAYLARLPDQHVLHSCGFHGVHGCTLAREQRGDICNEYECPGLEQVREAATHQGVQRFYVVRHSAEDGALGGFVPPLTPSLPARP